MRHARFRHDHLFARRISPRSNLPHALFARFLGRPLLVLLVRVFLRARKSNAASNTVVRTVCNPSWPQRTLPTVCHVTGISMLRVHRRLETVCISW